MRLLLALLMWLMPTVLMAQPVATYAIPAGLEDTQEDEFDGIALADNGNVAVTGIMRGNLRVLDTTLFNAGQGDIFLFNLSPTGALLWSKRFGSAGEDNAFDMATDGTDYYLSGWFTGTVAFDSFTLVSQGGTDMFVAKVDPAGNVLWATRFGGPGEDGGNEIAVTRSGDIAVSAISGGPFNVNGTVYPHRGTRDAYVIRMTTDGQVVWVTPFAGPGNERIRAICMFETGEVCVGFTFRNSLAVGNATIPAMGDWDGALALLGPDGSITWARHVGSSAGEDNVRGADAGADGSVYASGKITGPGNFFDRDVPFDLTQGGDYMVSISRTGEFEAYVSVTAQDSMGTELESYDGGFFTSGTFVGPATVRLNGRVIGGGGPASGRTAYLLGMADNGTLHTFYTVPLAPGGLARGGPLDISSDGAIVANAMRFRGDVIPGGVALDGHSTTESAAVLYTVN